MIAVDTNILVYAHRKDSAFHRSAYGKVAVLAEAAASWAIPWPCVHEFLSVATHPRIYAPPTPTAEAVRQIECWLASPSLQLIGESPEYWPLLRESVLAGKITGPKVHDVRISAICTANGVSVLWSADRDFSRIRGVKVVNPLV